MPLCATALINGSCQNDVLNAQDHLCQQQGAEHQAVLPNGAGANQSKSEYAQKRQE